MKKASTIKLLIICLILIFANPQLSKSGCYDSGPCQMGGWTDGTFTMTLPGFENCEIEFTYKSRQCIDTLTGEIRIEYRVYMFTIPTDTIACGDFIAQLTLPDGTGNIVFSMWVFDQANIKLPRELFLDSYNNANEVQKRTMECPLISRRYTRVHGDCTSFAIEELYYYTVEGYESYLVYRMDPCASGICCENIQEFCIDPVTKELVIMMNFLQYVYGGCSMPPPVLDTEGVILWQSECTDICYPWEN